MTYYTHAKFGLAALVAAMLSAPLSHADETAAQVPPAAVEQVPPAAVESASAGAVVATVEGHDITAADYVAYYRAFARQRFYHRTPPAAEVDALKIEVVERLVLFRLLQMEAARRNLEIDEEAIEKQIANMRGRFEHGAGRDEFEARVGELRSNLRSSAQVSKLAKLIREVPPPSEAEVRTFYAENLSLFTEPPRQRVRAILIGVQPWDPESAWETKQEVAKGVAEQLTAGADFAALAKQYSTHDSAADGGDLGYLHAGMLNNEAEDVVSGLEPGQHAGPIRTLEGYVVLQLVERTPAQTQPFEAVRERAAALRTREISEDQWLAFISRLRQDAAVEVAERLPLEIEAPAQ